MLCYNDLGPRVFEFGRNTEVTFNSNCCVVIVFLADGKTKRGYMKVVQSLPGEIKYLTTVNKYWGNGQGKT